MEERNILSDKTFSEICCESYMNTCEKIVKNLSMNSKVIDSKTLSAVLFAYIGFFGPSLQQESKKLLYEYIDYEKRNPWVVGTSECCKPIGKKISDANRLMLKLKRKNITSPTQLRNYFINTLQREIEIDSIEF